MFAWRLYLALWTLRAACETGSLLSRGRCKEAAVAPQFVAFAQQAWTPLALRGRREACPLTRCSGSDEIYGAFRKRGETLQCKPSWNGRRASSQSGYRDVSAIVLTLLASACPLTHVVSRDMHVPRIDPATGIRACMNHVSEDQIFNHRFPSPGICKPCESKCLP
jgi:hypothetical protein